MQFLRGGIGPVILGAAVFIAIGFAAVAPNPGGSVVVTNSVTATIQYVDTPVTQRVDNYSTTITAKLNNQVVFSQTYPAQYSDPTVQNAVAQADAVLSGSGAAFGAPVLATTNTALQSSVTVPPTTTITCQQAFNGSGVVAFATGVTTVTTTNTFGPDTIGVGQCRSDTFTILSGQLDINVNTDFVYNVPRNIVTTNTFLTTQTYNITGTTTAPPPTPIPPSWTLLALGACWIGFSQMRARRRA